MQFEPVSVADAVAAELRRRLRSGHYDGGERLRDTELSAEFAVARPTVRAAVQMLVADGLLQRGRGRSATVKSFTADDAIDLYRLGRAIEAVAVGKIVEEGRGLELVDAAADAFGRLPESASWDVVADHDVAFHRAVFVAAGSIRLLRAFDEVSTEHRLLVALLRPVYGSATELAREHDVLLEALRSRDVRRAQDAWTEHFDLSERFFLDQIKESSL